MVLIPLILNYGINTNAMEIARFALWWACGGPGSFSHVTQLGAPVPPFVCGACGGISVCLVLQ